MKKKISSVRPLKPAAKPSAEHRFPCVSFKQGKHDVVAFACPGKTLWSITKINEREEDKDEGYQRVLSSSRADRIAEFIDKGNLLPTSILVSFDKATVKKGVLHVPNVADAGWVIDGQHRLAGAHRSKLDVSLPVIAIIGLSVAEQIQCFVTINREHKGVPTSLYYELLKHLPNTKSETEVTKERAAELATSMRSSETSSFYNRIVITIAPSDGELSLTNWVRKIAPLLKTSGRLAAMPDESKIGVLDNYYRGLQQVFPKEYAKKNSIFFKTLGFGALINALPTFLDLTIQHCKSFKVADVAAMFLRIQHFDFEGWHRGGTGNAAELAAGEDLRSELTASFSSQQDGGAIILE